MATEELIVRAVRAGGDRQVAHERIRQAQHRRGARAQGRRRRGTTCSSASPADPAFGVSIDDMQSTLDPHRFVGRAPEQVDEFLDEVVAPLLTRRDDAGCAREEVRV